MIAALRCLPILAVLAVFMLMPGSARAGGCPTCSSHADCEAVSGQGSVCVEWDRDFGCGALRIACCPGQACALTAPGVPSCLGNGCVLYTGATGADGGSGDAPAFDVPIAADSGTSTGADSGGSSGGGGGGAGPRDRDTGCSCSASASSASLTSSAWLIGGLGLSLMRRRRI